MDDPLTKGLTDAGKFTLILGLVALVAGIWLGFFQTVSDDGVDCGTAFKGNSFVTAEELLGPTPDCDGGAVEREATADRSPTSRRGQLAARTY